jgi:hypothetical protein
MFLEGTMDSIITIIKKTENNEMIAEMMIDWCRTEVSVGKI